MPRGLGLHIRLKKRCLLAVLLAFSVALAAPVASGAAVSGDAVFSRPLSAGDRPAIMLAMKALTEYPLTVGNFRQTRTVKKLNREFVSTGSFAIDREAGILWDTQKPFASVMLVGESSIVQWDSSRNVKKPMSARDNPAFADFSRTIQSVFSGKFDELERNFKIFFEKKGETFCIGLVPKEKAVARVVASIVLSGKAELENVTIVDGEGNPVVYEFAQHRHYADLESVEAPFVDIAHKFQKLK